MAGSELNQLSKTLYHHWHLADRFLSMFTKKELDKIHHEAINTLPVTIQEVAVRHQK